MQEKLCKHCGVVLTKTETTRKNYMSEWFLSKPKNIFGTDYYRVACTDCFTKKYKSLPAPPNIMDRKTMEFFLEVPEEIIQKVLSSRGVTKERMITRYGEEEGSRRWDEYRRKQAITNSFEYKKEKYGWDEEDFNRYNKSRSQTLDNMILRYGEEEGSRRWDEYCKRQSVAGITLEYFIDKYGGDVIAAKERLYLINKMKSNSYDAYVLRYGEEEGSRRWQDYLSIRSNGYSEISCELFGEIDRILGSPDDIYYAKKNFEFVVRRKGTKAHFLDFIKRDNNKVIEFFGDYWHMNPKLYRPDQVNAVTGCRAKDHWVRDSKRIQFLTECGFDVKIIWESDFIKDKHIVVEECIKFLTS